MPLNEAAEDAADAYAEGGTGLLWARSETVPTAEVGIQVGVSGNTLR